MGSEIDLKRSELNRQIVLSLDGGGIKGYSSLLIVKRLMQKIVEIETGNQENVPLAAASDGTSPELPLPSDYFDYMFGSSTGGLSAIMLGRIKMSVDDALEVYEQFGSKVFGNPRTMHVRSPLWWPRSKYNWRTFVEVLKKVVGDNIPQADDGQANDFYPQPNPNDCKTVVVAVRDGNSANKPFLFRTYDHEVPANVRLDPLERNPGRAYIAKICEIARATTAAPGYFSAMTINEANYLDGGLGHNNPSKLAYHEVEQMHPVIDPAENGTSPISLILSIGTGKKATDDHIAPAGIRRYSTYFRRAVRHMTNVEEVELDLQHLSEKRRFEFRRLNVDEGLETMEMDEWHKDNSTLENIRTHTERYLQIPKTVTVMDHVARHLVRFHRERRLLQRSTSSVS
ncbi:acyl transferase/acyl hydrolase/lysophospholipase [Pyronema omphalodes]|nr:acyl transferase/acyl hydrolase/lysophospholipase [Pyronema omphalodes]